MSPIRFARLLAPALMAVAIAAPAMSQQERYDTIFFRTKLGSFKILGVADKLAEGRIEMTFTGTVLVNGTPKITPTGSLRREYYRPEHQQTAYHGTGKLIIDGKFDSIQWFGRDMNAKWTGFGVARLFGEFDKDLNTGEYWYIENPADIHEWGALGSRTVNNPPSITDYKVIPKARGGGK